MSVNYLVSIPRNTTFILDVLHVSQGNSHLGKIQNKRFLKVRNRIWLIPHLNYGLGEHRGINIRSQTLCCSMIISIAYHLVVYLKQEMCYENANVRITPFVGQI